MRHSDGSPSGAAGSRGNEVRITRRAALRGGLSAGVGLAVAGGGLPAWARPVAQIAGVRSPGSRPFPRRPEGVHSIPQVKHVVVVMMENHSFDNILGMLPHRFKQRRHVDGLPVSSSGVQLAVNMDSQNQPVREAHTSTVCPPSGVDNSWDASHISWDGGANDGFARASGAEAMTFFDRSDLPFTYSLARRFPVGQRYFCSVLGPTYPNRRFLLAGTANGLITTDAATLRIPATNGTIFDRLDRLGISWKTYYTNVPSMTIIPGVVTRARGRHFARISQYYADAAAGRLPQVAFVEPEFRSSDEEPPQDAQYGERFVSKVVRALLASPNWQASVLFYTYDEHGGFYDHVPPPPAIKPDAIPPRLAPGNVPGAYDRYGMRVPLVAVSPFARPNYVSRVVQDHTSILKFIETVWNIGALTFRDANARNMIDYFDFSRRAFLHPPALAGAPDIGPGLAACHAASENPPAPVFPV
jgi:phospholipase C